MSSFSSSASSRSSSPEPSYSPVKRKRRNEDVTDTGTDSNTEELGKEEPVLSHAERRKQKKKRESITESATKKRKLQDGKPATAVSMKRQNSVWVGNLLFKTTPDDLRRFFEGAGEITRIHMPTKAPTGPGKKGENRGFAYVDFATPDAKTSAIAKSEQPLIGRKLLIKDGSDFTGRPAAPDDAARDGVQLPKTHSKTAQKILNAQKQPPAPTLFLGNLGFETTEESIRQLLEAHQKKPKKTTESHEKTEKTKDGWIRKVRMGTFEDSGLCKGFAFVDFMAIEDATSALTNPRNHQLNGRNLVVEYASPDAVRRGTPKGRREESGMPRRKRPLSHNTRPDRSEQRQDEDIPRLKEGSDKGEDSQIAEHQQYTELQPVERKGGTQPSVAKRSGRKEKGPRVRPKPGAALALAKRESAAIVPSKGQKITF